MDDITAQIRNYVEREILGKGHDSFNIDTISWLAAAIQSSDYAQKYMNDTPRMDKWKMLDKAARESRLDGLFLEFGVFSGDTITAIAKARPDNTIYGFDSFKGLPESWARMAGEGQFKMEGLPHVPDNVELVVGWFDRSLPAFLDRHPEKPVSFIHIDCDLYYSTQIIFSQLRGRIAAGTIIQFDEYFNYPGWKDHEFKAFQEFISTQNLGYDYIAVNPASQQVAVRIKG